MYYTKRQSLESDTNVILQETIIKAKEDICREGKEKFNKEYGKTLLGKFWSSQSSIDWNIQKCRILNRKTNKYDIDEKGNSDTIKVVKLYCQELNSNGCRN